MAQDNVYPNVDNYPVPTFPSEVEAPSVDPDEGALITVAYNPAWTPVLMGACLALLLPSTWEGTHDEKITALNRAATLQLLLQNDVTEIPAPYWDDEDAEDADDEMPPAEQPWYGQIVIIDDNLTFVENIGFWLIVGFVAYAGTPAAAIAFYPIARRFVVSFKKHDLGGIIKAFVDGAEVGQADSYSPSSGVGEMTIVMPEPTMGLLDDDLPPVLWLEMSDEFNPAVEGEPNIQIFRKRLTESEVTPANLRYNAECDCVEMTPDGGTTWNRADGSDPRRAAGFRLPPRTGVDRKCDAAANMLKWLKDFIDSVTDALAGGALAFQVANQVLAFYELIFGEVGVLIGLVIEAASILFGIGAGALEAAFTSDQYDLLLCIFLCAADADGQISADGFASIQSQVNLQLNVTAALVANLILGSQGEVGVSNAGAIGVETGDCSDCDDCGWCYRFDDDHQLGDWENLYWNSPSNPLPTFSDGFWHSACFTSGHQVDYINLLWTFASPIELTDAAIIDLEYVCSGGGGADIIVNTDGLTTVGITVWSSGGGFTPPGVPVNTICIHLACVDAGCPDINFPALQFSGTGTNPFGENNC